MLDPFVRSFLKTLISETSHVCRAGGGGSKSKDRRLKLKVKNDKLRQERERRAIELASSEGKSVVMPKPVQKKKDDVSKRSVNQDIHPSRRARVGVSK